GRNGLHGPPLRYDVRKAVSAQFPIFLHPECIPWRGLPGPAIFASPGRAGLVSSPRAQARESLRRQPDGAAHVQPARQPLVLVIERSTELNHFIADSLRRDFHVVQAFNGREGLERARKLRPALILCDAGIPVSGSTAPITEMRRQRDLAGTPVLSLSNGHDEHARLRLFEEGSQDFITRPFSRREMCLRARNLVAIMEARRREREEAAVAEALYRVSAAFSRELDPQKLVQRVTDEATALTGAEFGAFFFNVEREDGGRYMLHTLSGASADAFAHFPMPRATPLFGPTFRGETVIRSDDIRRQPRYRRTGGRPEGDSPAG